MTNLLQGRDARRAGRLGDPRFLGRKVEVLGIRIGDTGLITGLTGEPDKETLQGGQRSIQRCLAQWLTTALTALVGKVALESLGLLDMEPLEVFVPGIGFEARDRALCCATGRRGTGAVRVDRPSNNRVKKFNPPP